VKIRSLLNLLDLSIARLQFNKEKFFSFEKNGSFVNITAFGNAMLVSKTNLCKKIYVFDNSIISFNTTM